MKKLIFLAMILQSCLVSNPENNLNLVLDSVEHESEGTFGGMSFSDSLINIKFTLSYQSLGFTLQNKTNKSLKIIWDESAYINEKGESKRVIHEGVKLIDRSQSQPSTTVIRGSVISDSVVPSDNIHYMSGQYGGWQTRPLFDTFAFGTLEQQKKLANIRGKQISLMIPIAYEGRTREYLFTFNIK